MLTMPPHEDAQRTSDRAKALAPFSAATGSELSIEFHDESVGCGCGQGVEHLSRPAEELMLRGGPRALQPHHRGRGHRRCCPGSTTARFARMSEFRTLLAAALQGW